MILCPSERGVGVLSWGRFSLMLLAYPHEDMVMEVKFFLNIIEA
jgi:hypothetical protein